MSFKYGDLSVFMAESSGAPTARLANCRISASMLEDANKGLPREPELVLRLLLPDKVLPPCGEEGFQAASMSLSHHHGAQVSAGLARPVRD